MANCVCGHPLEWHAIGRCAAAFCQCKINGNWMPGTRHRAFTPSASEHMVDRAAGVTEERFPKCSPGPGCCGHFSTLLSMLVLECEKLPKKSTEMHRILELAKRAWAEQRSGKSFELSTVNDELKRVNGVIARP